MQRILFFVLCLIVPGAQAGPPGRDLTGTWKVDRVLDAQPTTSISSDEAEKLIGTLLVIMHDHIRFAGADCVKPSVSMARRRFYSYFVKSYNFEPKGIPLPDVVSEATVTCRVPVGIDFIYVRDRRRIVLYWEGFFLDAVKVQMREAVGR